MSSENAARNPMVFVHGLWLHADSWTNWVEFFRQGDSYRGTEFLRHSLEPGRYATIDRWDSAAQYQSFHDQHAAEYQALDEQCEQLTAEERYIGSYDTF